MCSGDTMQARAEGSFVPRQAQELQELGVQTPTVMSILDPLSSVITAHILFTALPCAAGQGE